MPGSYAAKTALRAFSPGMTKTILRRVLICAAENPQKRNTAVDNVMTPA
jgi:hypothetical protein